MRHIVKILLFFLLACPVVAQTVPGTLTTIAEEEAYTEICSQMQTVDTALSRTTTTPGILKLTNRTLRRDAVFDYAVIITTDLYNRLNVTSSTLASRSTRNPIDDYVNVVQRIERKKGMILKLPTTKIKPDELRELLQYLYSIYDIEGAILVGQWPIPLWACTTNPDIGRVGPCMSFYSDLDPGEFYTDTTEGYYNTFPSALNRIQRKSFFSHTNTSYLFDTSFTYGHEIWVIPWRATGIKDTVEYTQYRQEEVIQLSRMINKFVSFHNKKAPFFIQSQPCINDVYGICHTDYSPNCDIAQTEHFQTANFLNDLTAGHYNLLTASAQILPLLATNNRSLILDVWSHGTPYYICPGNCLAASTIYTTSQQNSGFLIVPIFGCSTGNFLHTELGAGYNTPIALLTSNGITMVSVGSPYSNGFSYPYKKMMYHFLLNQNLYYGDVVLKCANEDLFLSAYYNPTEVTEYLEGYLYFGDPYFKYDYVGE